MKPAVSLTAKDNLGISRQRLRLAVKQTMLRRGKEMPKNNV